MTRSTPSSMTMACLLVLELEEALSRAMTARPASTVSPQDADFSISFTSAKMPPALYHTSCKKCP